jgi:phage-related tail fiber protein
VADPIRIRRRTSGNVGAPATLLNAEPAYNEVEDVLYIGVGLGGDGNATTIKAIAGAGVFATKAYVTAAVAAVDVSSQLANYLTTAAASSTYLTVSAASSTYLTQSSAAATYAPLASPSLTGTPTAPTAATSTNTQQIATTAFVQAVVSALIAGAPGALDTLNELAAALGNDASFASTVTNALAAKLAAASNLSDLTSASTARTNLGLGSMATQSASNVAITGGTIDGVTLDGGTF